MTELEFHPIANTFPMFSKEKRDELAEDIKLHGLLDPVWLYEGKILDGRNRYEACKSAGVKVTTRKYEGDTPVAFVVSHNSKRRDLTKGQRAAVALNLKPFFEDEAKGRQKEHGNTAPGKPKDTSGINSGSDTGDSRDFAGEQMGVNGKYVSDVETIRESAPQKFEAIQSGDKTITEAKRELAKEAAVEKVAALPSDKFRVLYADPPWKYGDTREGLEGTTGAESHYPTMTIKELCAMPIVDIVEDDAVLFLWVTSPLLFACAPIIGAWGFKYKTSFVWDKVKHNMGHYNSVRHELLLVCTRGSCTPDVKKLYDSVQSVERSRKHSEKPEVFRKIIDTLYPHGKRIELFSRKRVKGWKNWGSEDL